jgi:hypothetical protein
LVVHLKYAFENSFNLGAYDNFRGPTDPYYGTFRSYSSVDAFLLDAAQPFASSSIKQNLYAQTPMIQEILLPLEG